MQYCPCLHCICSDRLSTAKWSIQTAEKHMFYRKRAISRIINCYTAVGQLRGSQGAICASKIPNPIGGLACFGPVRLGSKCVQKFCAPNFEMVPVSWRWCSSCKKQLSEKHRPWFFNKTMENTVAYCFETMTWVQKHCFLSMGRYCINFFHLDITLKLWLKGAWALIFRIALNF